MNCSPQSIFLDKIKSYKENDLSKKVLIPLFYAFKNEKVEFHGGTIELGKDIICWKHDELLNIELSLVVVKKYRPSANAKDKESFNEIVRQLHQCFEIKVPHTNGQHYKPTFVYLVTPYEINVRALQTRFEGMRDIPNGKIKIIDGTILYNVTQRLIPDVYSSIIGNISSVYTKIHDTLTNIDLMKALNGEISDAIDNYCELDFGLGKKLHYNILTTKPKHAPTIISITEEEWMNIKPIIIRAKEILNMDIIEENTSDIDGKFDFFKKRNSDSLKQRDELNENLTRSKNKLEALEIKLASIMENFSDDKCHENIFSLAQSVITKLDKVNTNSYSRNKTAIQIKFILEQHESIAKEQTLITKQRNDVTKTIIQPQISIKISNHNISRTLSDIPKKIFTKFNARKSSNNKSLLLETQKMFSAIDDIINNTILLSNLNKTTIKNLHNVYNIKISSPLNEIFNTGLNVAIYGDAGAGKTTTLQKYAHDKITRGNDNTFTLYIPLSRISKYFHDLTLDQDNVLTFFEEAITLYIDSLGQRISKSDLIEQFENKSTTLLLDGIDEIIKKVPYIISAIIMTSKKYPKMQIVTSSRMCGDYISTIPFLPISLLEFIDDQRNSFIRGWFKNKVTNQADVVINHISSLAEISKIVRNPLISTILCFLAEKQVPLPDTKIRIYECRLNLLLGHYDIHKNIYRISSQQDDLLKLCRRLAFSLHKNNLRYAFYDDLFSRAYTFFKDTYSEERIKTMLDELIDPCNILVPMTDEGQLGFGHLSYQEFLVAKELTTNRNIEIGHLMFDHWWKGPLVFFAKMVDNLKFLLEWLIENHSTFRAEQTFMAMLNERPKKEVTEIQQIYKRYADQDITDISLDRIDEYIDDLDLDDYKEELDYY